MSIFSTTQERKIKQIAINLVSGVSTTIRANPGVHSPSNILTPPNRLKYAQTAFIVIVNEKTNSAQCHKHK